MSNTPNDIHAGAASGGGVAAAAAAAAQHGGEAAAGSFCTSHQTLDMYMITFPKQERELAAGSRLLPPRLLNMEARLLREAGRHSAPCRKRHSLTSRFSAQTQERELAVGSRLLPPQLLNMEAGLLREAGRHSAPCRKRH